MNSVYQQITPQAKDLKPFIKLYYTHQSNDEKAIEKITYYPNYVTTINIYENSRLSWDVFSRTHEYEANKSFLKLLVSKFDRSREIVMKGKYNKLTIVFNPLGLNHFLDTPLSNLAETHFSFFEYFGDSFERLLTQVFRTDSLEAKRDLLDAFFLEKLLGFKEQRLQFALNKLLTGDANLSVHDISEELSISRKTLLRLFKTHLAYTPREYKSIVKFRNALYIYKNQIQKTSLSALSYNAHFYDQSDLNANFKVKTGLSPKQLFSMVETVAKDLYWNLQYVPKVQEIEKPE